MNPHSLQKVSTQSDFVCVIHMYMDMYIYRSKGRQNGKERDSEVREIAKDRKVNVSERKKKREKE